jgi:UDP-glucose 4-epimerase
MNIAILGGAGFIGSVLSEKLIQANNNVLIIDKFVHKDSFQFAKVLRELGCQVISHDINDVETLKKSLSSDIEVIFHLAANSNIRPRSSNINLDFQDTLGTTLSLAEAIKMRNISHIIFASSSAIFGEEGKNINKKTHEIKSLNPISDYGKAKLASEYLLQNSFARGGIDKLSVCRFPNVVGRNATHGILFDLFLKKKAQPKILNILGNGTQFKPYIDVEVMCDQLIYWLMNELEGIRFHNIGPRENLSVHEIVEKFLELTEWRVQTEFQFQREGWLGDVAEYSFQVEENNESLPTSLESITSAIHTLNSDERFN